jgi:acyl transferase domain-containing protein
VGARLSHYLGITGINICPESGCSSSSVAVGLGVQSLRKGDVNVALACGINLLVAPFSKSAFSGLLSDDYRCHVFDEGANGFARAEGYKSSLNMTIQRNI